MMTKRGGKLVDQVLNAGRRMAKDWAQICHRLGESNPLPPGRRRVYPAECLGTPEQRQRVAWFYRQDYEMFGYKEVADD